MKSIELAEKVKSAQERVAKIEATIAKHEAAAQKKLDILINKGYGTDDSIYRCGANYNYDAICAISDYEWKLEDIKNAKYKLADAKTVLNNWIEKYDKQVDLETKIETEMPEIFTQLKEALAIEWRNNLIYRRERMLESKSTLTGEEFRKLYLYSEMDRLRKTDEEFYNESLKDAELFIVDLYNRVKAKTGEVTDWSGIHYSGKALNGRVTGVNGTAYVETIAAGGYNIQRYHLRVLVK